MAFKSKRLSKKRRDGRGRAHPQRAAIGTKAPQMPQFGPIKKKFGPAHAYPAVLKEALDPESSGPGVLDLISLHFKDKGYKTSVDGTMDGLLWGQIHIDFTHRMPWKESLFTGNYPSSLSFSHKNGEITHRHHTNPVSADIVVGRIEDPNLLNLMEGFISVYLMGALNLQSWVKGTLK